MCALLCFCFQPLFLLPALQKWQLGILVFLLLVVHNLSQLHMYIVIFSPLQFLCIWLLQETYVQTEALQQRVPSSSLSQQPFTEHLFGLLAHRMKFKLHIVWQVVKDSKLGPPHLQPLIVILIIPCSPDPKSSTSPTSQACRFPAECLLLSPNSLHRPPDNALLGPFPGSLQLKEAGLNYSILHGRKQRLRRMTFQQSHSHPARLTGSLSPCSSLSLQGLLWLLVQLPPRD